MTRWLIIAAGLALLFWLSATATLRLVGQGGGDLVKGTEVSVPSGQRVWFLDRDIGVSGDAGQSGDSARVLYRFVAPQVVVNEYKFDDVSQDMLHLCQVILAIHQADEAPEFEQIVVALAERETTMGETNPEVAKFFEAFRSADNTCVREVF